MITKPQKQKIDVVMGWAAICAFGLTFITKQQIFMGIIAITCMFGIVWNQVPIVLTAVRTGRYPAGGRIYQWRDRKALFCFGVLGHFLMFAIFAIALYAVLRVSP